MSQLINWLWIFSRAKKCAITLKKACRKTFLLGCACFPAFSFRIHIHVTSPRAPRLVNINKLADLSESLEIYTEMKVEFFPNRYENVPFRYLDAMHRFWTIQKKIEWNSSDAICFGWYCCHFLFAALECSISARNLKRLYYILCVIARENSDTFP